MLPSATPSHREVALLDALRRLGGSGRSAELATMLDVSEETVRRTIKALAKVGSVERVHGGAHLVGPGSNGQRSASFFRRMGENPQEKQEIAQVVLPRIHDGMTVFLDVGSTTSFVAEALRLRRNLTVVTNSIGVAQLLANHNGNRLHLLGGEMRSDDRGTFGPVAEQQLARFALDVAVLSADALSAKHGLLFHNAAEAQLTMTITAAAEQVFVVTTHAKFSEQAPHRGPLPQQLDLLVSDREPGKKLARALVDWGTEFALAQPAPEGD
ncbi:MULTISPECIES: DeoR/GlpR family DNA-binding transcription regulator [Pseudophaeobacter]|uniref:DeoR/GlpR family DNA-binding transcription regulator n=1 Tax=Pseudophaeobacter TaxID=1541822 RepID=UPI00242D9D80|nr:DeoR/GlpR family DNA-binding transcription regulator [Pseudophaeobacter profundi]